MASVRAAVVGGGTSGTSDRTVTFTTVAGDFVVVTCVVAANTNATPSCTDDNPDGLGTYFLVGSAPFASGTGTLSVFVRKALVGNAASTTATVATGSNTAGALVAMMVTGMLRVGSQAARQSAFVGNQSPGTPSATFGIAALAANPTIPVVGTDAFPAAATPTGWTSQANSQLTSPNTADRTDSRDSGFAGATITWSGNNVGNFACAILELDSDLPPVLGVAIQVASGVPCPAASGIVSGMASTGVASGMANSGAAASTVSTGQAGATATGGAVAALATQVHP